MTAVTISGTFSKDERPNNGLEAIAQDLITNQLGRHVVIGIVQFAGATMAGPNEPLVPRAKFLAIEPLTDDAADQGRQILDQARKQRGLGLLAESLFDVPVDPGYREPAAEFDGQAPFPGTDPDDGGVPEPSAEELMAERREAKEREAREAEQDGGESS